MSFCKEPRFAPHKLCKPDVGWIVIMKGETLSKVLQAKAVRV